MTTVISARNLTKSFGSFRAVDSVSLTINAGEIYGFLGLNGAGKSTTIKMLLGMIKPDHGTIEISGNNYLYSKNIWNEVGYIVDAPACYPNLSVYDNLKLFALYRNLASSAINEIISRLRLDRYQHIKAANLSMGNLQRLGLAKAMMHHPNILILDEPVNGLDPAGIVEVRELLLELSHNGSTIFISSHILGEISRIATRVGVIHKGSMIAELTTSQLNDDLQKKVIVDTTDNQKAVTIFNEHGIGTTLKDGNIEIINTKNIIDTPELSELIVNNGIRIREMYHDIEDLEHYFLRLIDNQ